MYQMKFSYLIIIMALIAASSHADNLYWQQPDETGEFGVLIVDITTKNVGDEWCVDLLIDPKVPTMPTQYCWDVLAINDIAATSSRNGPACFKQTTEVCRADLDGDGSISLRDVSAVLGMFFSGATCGVE
jgi:hypothetical protein